MRTLLLNADFMPIQAISWQKAICLWFDEKIEIVEEYEDFMITSVSMNIKCPAVVRLLSYKKHFNKKDKVKFSRYNIFYRDNFQCQYCGNYHENGTNLTFDHVVPKFHGGKTEWSNIVSACHSCNSKKGNKLLKDCGMKLLKIPKEPKISEISKGTVLTRRAPDIWKNYIF